MPPSHINTGQCPACAIKLQDVDSRLVAFAIGFQKAYPEAHISCGYRDAASQAEAFATGHSNAKPGQSKHNLLPSQALDWFRLTQAGGASFDRLWYETYLAPAAKAAGFTWGGDWKSIKDFPHIELA